MTKHTSSPGRGLSGGPEDTEEDAALRLYQSCIDSIDRAFWARDWAACAPCFMMPHRLAGPDNDRLVEGADTFLTLLKAARDNFDASGATEYHRIAKEARFESDTQLSGRHESYILRGGMLLVPAYAGYARFENHEGRWLSVSLYADKPEAKLPLFQADRVRMKPPPDKT